MAGQHQAFFAGCTDTVATRLVPGIQATSADDPLVRKLAANGPRGHRAGRICEAARLAGLSPALVGAVYAIETSFRPLWVRVFEDAYLFLAAFGWLITRRSFRNISVGPFQIGLHWLADYMRAEYVREGDTWRPRLSLRLACALFKLPFFETNLQMAIYRIQTSWEQAIREGKAGDSAIARVGTRYNGRESYGMVLVKLTDYLAKFGSASGGPERASP